MPPPLRHLSRKPGYGGGKAFLTGDLSEQPRREKAVTHNATQLLAAGVPIKVASERSGHCGIAITADIYAHVTAAMQEEAAQKLDIAPSSAITRGSAG